MRIHSSRERGFTMVEILIVIAIIGVMTAIALPNFLKNREYVHKDLCIQNLTKIEAAKQMWGIANNKSSGAPVTPAELVGPTLYFKIEPLCPANGNISYDFGSIGVTASCEIPTHVIN